jgi:Na+/H+ antiporter NhaD/arsenite permease-like protein
MKELLTNPLLKLIHLLNRPLTLILGALAIVLGPALAFASEGQGAPAVFGIRGEFILFALTLIGVAVFHKKTMYVALIGLASILIFKLLSITGFSLFNHLFGHGHEEGEWRILINLLGLLFGFAILAKHFEESRLPDILPNFLPDGWKGGFVLLTLITILSSFLDNIAAAMIGGTIARVVFKGKVHIGFLAGIVAASNAGGSGSVVGDTTTTLMWIDGVSPLAVLHAFVAAAPALLIFGIFGALQQDKLQPIVATAVTDVKVDYGRLVIVFLILAFAIVTNWALDFPAAGVWIGIILGAFIRKTPWYEMKNAWMGTVFLMSLVTCASLMPVEDLPKASWHVAFSLGFVSAVFDNIPLTKLCLVQGGYDWGMLAYTVGFGGSMIWFGSSAGVALSNQYPETRSAVAYVKHGWHVTVAYIVGFFVLLAIMGWTPSPKRSDMQKSDLQPTVQIVEVIKEWPKPPLM